MLLLPRIWYFISIINLQRLRYVCESYFHIAYLSRTIKLNAYDSFSALAPYHLQPKRGEIFNMPFLIFRLIHLTPTLQRRIMEMIRLTVLSQFNSVNRRMHSENLLHNSEMKLFERNQFVREQCQKFGTGTHGNFL